MTRFVTLLLTLAMLGAVVALATPAYAQEQEGCSDAYLSGYSPYAVYWQGFTSSAGKQVPWAGTGVLSFTATGQVTASFGASVNGVPKTDTATGTYTVGANCLGSLTVSPVNGGTFTASFIAADGGYDVEGSDTTPGDTMTFYAYTVFDYEFPYDECGDGWFTYDIPELVYWQGYTSAAGKQVPWAGNGELNLNADGSATATLYASVNGVSKTDTATGTYTVGINCVGSLTLSPVNGRTFTATFVAPFSGEDLQGIDSTSGDTMSFSGFELNDNEEEVVDAAAARAAARAAVRAHLRTH